MSFIPDDVQLVHWLSAKALAYFAAERYEDACEAAREAVDLNTNELFNGRADAFLQLAASSAWLDREAQAHRALDDARELRPALNEAVALAPLTAADPDLRERYLVGLRRAGLEDD